MRRFHTDRHHIQWCLEFSWDGALVSAPPNCGSGIGYRNRVYNRLRGFRQQLQGHDAPGRIVGIEIVPRRISEGE